MEKKAYDYAESRSNNPREYAILFRAYLDGYSDAIEWVQNNVINND